MLTVYGIESCETCRKARQYLTRKNIEHRFHDVRDDGLDIRMLDRWADRIGWEKLVNRKSLTWRKIPEVDRASMNRDKAMAAIIDRPTLLKRPVLEDDHFLAVGFSEQRFTAFLDSV